MTHLSSLPAGRPLAPPHAATNPLTIVQEFVALGRVNAEVSMEGPFAFSGSVCASQQNISGPASTSILFCCDARTGDRRHPILSHPLKPSQNNLTASIPKDPKYFRRDSVRASGSRPCRERPAPWLKSHYWIFLSVCPPGFTQPALDFLRPPQRGVAIKEPFPSQPLPGRRLGSMLALREIRRICSPVRANRTSHSRTPFPSV